MNLTILVIQNFITNFSSHVLTFDERSALNKGLNYSFLPSYFDFLQIQASLERFYQETRSYLGFKERIDLKRMIFNLYSKYKSGYFHLKQQKKFNLNKGELKPITDLCQNRSIYIRNNTTAESATVSILLITNQKHFTALMRSAKSIIVCKPDKGDVVVLLNKSDYGKKMEDILLDGKQHFKTTKAISKLSILS